MGKKSLFISMHYCGTDGLWNALFLPHIFKHGIVIFVDRYFYPTWGLSGNILGSEETVFNL